MANMSSVLLKCSIFSIVRGGFKHLNIHNGLSSYTQPHTHVQCNPKLDTHPMTRMVRAPRHELMFLCTSPKQNNNTTTTTLLDNPKQTCGWNEHKHCRTSILQKIDNIHMWTQRSSQHNANLTQQKQTVAPYKYATTNRQHSYADTNVKSN